MKKILICCLVCLLAVLTLTSCKGKKTEATKAVEEMIKAIGTVTLDSEEQLNEIKKAYTALSADEKNRVKNYDDYQEAVNELKTIQTRFKSYDEMNATIQNVIDTAATSFSEDGVNYTDLIAAGQEILDRYEDMDKEAKENVKVTDEFKTALETLKSIAGDTEAIAAEYVKAFYTVFADEKYEVTNIYCIKQVRDETQYNIFALTYKDAAGNETTLYANARCSNETKAATIAENKESFFAKSAVSDVFNAAENGNVPLDVDAVLKLAK